MTYDSWKCRDDLLESEEDDRDRTMTIVESEYEMLCETIKEQTEQIASLRKQLDWYRNDDNLPTAFNAMKQALQAYVAQYGKPHRDEWMNDDAFWQAMAVREQALKALALAEGRS